MRSLLERADGEEMLRRIHQLRPDSGRPGVTTAPHPFFGPLTTAERETLQWKHLDHHLRQFSV